jgi:hypothetical protein
MSRRIRLSFLGLASAIIAMSIISVAAGSVPQDNRAHMIEVEYYQQRHPYFCGQATIQMAINMVQDRNPSQFRIRDEVPFIENRGTSNRHVNIPFRNRDINIVRNGIFSNQAHLRNSVDHGHISIINIRFEQGGNSGHYVLVTGYNATGFFIHDPWPEEWGAPYGRETGENAYIDNSQLNRLWAFRLFWVITITNHAPNNNAGIGAMNNV